MLFIKRFLIFLLFFAGLLAGALAYYAFRPLALPSVPFEFSVNQGSSLKTTARQLQQIGVLNNDLIFVSLARLLGKTTQIKSGNYELETAPTPLELLEMMTQGRGSQNEIGIIEGWSFSKLRDELNSNSTILHDTLNLSEQEIMMRIGAKENDAEGLFFPDTYYFANGSSDLSIFKRAYQNMQKHLQENWQTRDQNIPLTSPYQALILASIIEKETGQAKDRSMIAGVFINRLRKGMLLQTDPTVIYGMGERYKGKLHKQDLQTDTRYNTYTRPGLTPTPIALPGLAAIEAALHPAKTEALYFVARGDGSSEFSKSLEQHNRAINRYLK
jgi:UPF0755 protein